MDHHDQPPYAPGPNPAPSQPYVAGPNPGQPQSHPGQSQQPQYGQPSQYGQQPPYGQMQQWQPQQPMPYQGMQPVVKAKSPGVAAVLSFLWPGLGQIMNGDIGIGILMMVLVVIAWLSLMILIGVVLLPALYIWSIVDAYSKANRWNQAHGIIS
ncbi:hypothetical protein AB0E69_11835 [Kribbella sp. NPDC026611]|uniref:hypothetical protein n=1 Tax=Kribbella sp. NPDC026611 TaxID=3154911 RepID=UPI0033C1B474